MDEAGAVVPGAKITAMGVERQAYETSSDPAGRFDLVVPPGIYRIEFTAEGFGTHRLLNYSVPNTSHLPLSVVLPPHFGLCDYVGCELSPDVRRVEDLGDSSVSSDLIPRPRSSTDRQGTRNVKLTGRVTDSEGAAISKARILAVSTLGSSETTVTGIEGRYELFLSTGEYSLKIDGVPGFRTIIVRGLQIEDRELSLDVALDVDFESRTSFYTEFFCGSDGICKIIDRKGDGQTEPKMIIIKPRSPD